ncbi:MAG TPA: DHHA1 domain-containing protein, partial [Candidatus Limnocylindria bacterium]|nr:DHHA1 domain-containing protein [Candidatus Limnocylindria bacterium]
ADCGTADEGALARAADLGLDVIVCDHHHAPTRRPPALALLNPLQPGCAFPFKGLSGAGVVFYLLMGLRAELRARGHDRLPDLRRYLDLVALGTVADVVPLREENRVLVAHGLRSLERTARPGLVALKETALVDAVSVRAIGFRLAPRLNAGGRLADARVAVELLITESEERARALAAELEVQNAERRALEEAMVAEAVSALEASRDPQARTIVVAREGWHPGVVGIVAARLAERFHRPTLAIALEGATARGSGRSVRGVHLHAALGECRALFEAFGGHRQAVGFTLRRERVGELAARFEQAVAGGTRPADLEPLLEIDAEAPLPIITPALAEALGVLEPHGPGNPEPALVARSVEIEGVRRVGDPARPHLRLRLRQDGRTLPAVGFGLGALPVRVGDRVDVVFRPRLERWQGTERLEAELLDVRGAAPPPAAQTTENAREFGFLDVREPPCYQKQ